MLLSVWIDQTLSSIAVGENKTDKEIAESVKEVNDYIKENGELGFVEEAADDTKAQYDKFSEYIKPDDISNEDANKQMKAEFASMFTSLKGRKPT